MLISYMGRKKSSIYIVLMALNLLLLVSCSSNNPIQKINFTNENNSDRQCSESYCGRGWYITYDERDIINGEINGNSAIYFSDMETEKDIIYTNPECYRIYEIALSGEWIYFTERFGESDDMIHYLSCVKTDGSGYRKIKEECQAYMLSMYKENIYYKDGKDNKLKCYNITNNTEMEIVDYVSEFCCDDGKLYVFNGHNREVIVIDIETGETTTLEGVFREPFVRKNEIYYTRDKSEDAAFQKNDVYYICRKSMDGREEVLYETTDYIFSYVVLDESIIVSQGEVNDIEECWDWEVDDITNLQGKLIQIQFGSFKENVIRDDLCYFSSIYSTLNQLYFSTEEWNGKRWIYQHESLSLDAL